MTDPIRISKIPIIKMSGAKPEIVGIHSPIAITNKTKGVAQRVTAVKISAFERLMKRDRIMPTPEKSNPAPIRIFLHSLSESQP